MLRAKVAIPAELRPAYENFRASDPDFLLYAAVKRGVRHLAKLPAAQRTPVDTALLTQPPRALLHNWTVRQPVFSAPVLHKRSVSGADHVMCGGSTSQHPLDFVKACFVEQQVAKGSNERFASRSYSTALGGAALLAVAAATFLCGAALISAACLIGGSALLTVALSLYVAARSADRQAKVWHKAGFVVDKESVKLATTKDQWQAQRHAWLDRTSRSK